MPEPTTALIMGGAAALGAGGNAYSAGRLNRKNRKFQRDMYNLQRQHALQNFHMINDYNSPQAQMERLQQAGLNPALMYGQSASPGNSSGISEVSPPSASTTVPKWGSMASSGAATFLSSMYDMETKRAQLDNLRAQNSVILGEAVLKAAQARASNVSADRGEFDLGFEKELREVSADARREALRQTKRQTDIALRDDERRALMNASNLKEAGERILNMRVDRTYKGEQTRNAKEERARIRAAASSMRRDAVLKDLDIELKRQGIQPSDPMWSRALVRLIDSYLESGKNDKETTRGKSIYDRAFDYMFK